MNETNKFKDNHGDYIQAVEMDDGRIEMCTSGIPWLSPDKAIEFFEQGLALAKEVKAKQ